MREEIELKSVAIANGRADSRIALFAFISEIFGNEDLNALITHHQNVYNDASHGVCRMSSGGTESSFEWREGSRKLSSRTLNTSFEVELDEEVSTIGIKYSFPLGMDRSAWLAIKAQLDNYFGEGVFYAFSSRTPEVEEMLGFAEGDLN